MVCQKQCKFTGGHGFDNHVNGGYKPCWAAEACLPWVRLQESAGGHEDSRLCRHDAIATKPAGITPAHLQSHLLPPAFCKSHIWLLRTSREIGFGFPTVCNMSCVMERKNGFIDAHHVRDGALARILWFRPFLEFCRSSEEAFRSFTIPGWGWRCDSQNMMDFWSCQVFDSVGPTTYMVPDSNEMGFWNPWVSKSVQWNRCSPPMSEPSIQRVQGCRKL